MNTKQFVFSSYFSERGSRQQHCQVLPVLVAVALEVVQDNLEAHFAHVGSTNTANASHNCNNMQAMDLNQEIFYANFLFYYSTLPFIQSTQGYNVDDKFQDLEKENRHMC